MASRLDLTFGRSDRAAVNRGSCGSRRGLSFCRGNPSTTNPVSQWAHACARNSGSSLAPCRCLRGKRGRGEGRGGGSGRCVGCGLAPRGRPRRSADPVAPGDYGPSGGGAAGKSAQVYGEEKAQAGERWRRWRWRRR